MSETGDTGLFNYDVFKVPSLIIKWNKLFEFEVDVWLLDLRPNTEMFLNLNCTYSDRTSFESMLKLSSVWVSVHYIDSLI